MKSTVIVQKVEAPRLPEIDAEFAKSLGVADGDIAKMRKRSGKRPARSKKKSKAKSSRK